MKINVDATNRAEYIIRARNVLDSIKYDNDYENGHFENEWRNKWLKNRNRPIRQFLFGHKSEFPPTNNFDWARFRYPTIRYGNTKIRAQQILDMLEKTTDNRLWLSTEDLEVIGVI